MTDPISPSSGATPLTSVTTPGPNPNAGASATGAQNQQAQNPGAQAQNAQILRATGALQFLTQAANLPGQVAQINPDGTARITTNQGSLDVKPQIPLSPGENVNVQIPPGNPPQNARIAPEPQQPQQSQTQQQPQAPQSSAPAQNYSPPPPRGSATPVSVEVSSGGSGGTETTQSAPPPEPVQYAPPPPQAQSAQSQNQQPLTPGQPAQLEPITPQQLEALLTAPLDTAANVAPQALETEIQSVITPQTGEPLPQNLSFAPQPPVSSTGAPVTETISVSSPVKLIDLFQTPDAHPIENTATRGLQILGTSITGAVQSAQNSGEDFLTAPGIRVFPQDAGQNSDFLTPEISQAAPGTAQLSIPKFFTLPGGHGAPVENPAAAIIAGKPQTVLVRFSAAPAAGKQIQILAPGEIASGKGAIPAIEIPKNELPLILQNARAGAVTGVVIGQTAEDFPILAFQSGGQNGDGVNFTPSPFRAMGQELFFVLKIPAPNLPPGTEIPFLPSEAVIGLENLEAPAPLSFLQPGVWPLMSEISGALSQISPQAAQSLINLIPSPATPAQFEPAVMFFIAAAQGGDLSQWMSKSASEALRSIGRSGLLSRLSGEGSSLNKLFSEPMSQNWKAMSFPLYYEGDISKLAVYYKQDFSGGGKTDQGEKQVRFIFDMNLDQMGKVQLDGLFRPKRLDLIVRTLTPLSSPMQMQMRRAYISALVATEVKGELSFQNKPEQWVSVKAESKPHFGASA